MSPLGARWAATMAALILCLGASGPNAALAAGAAAQDSIITGVCEDAVLPLGIVPPEGGLQAGCSHLYTLKYGAGHGTRGTYGIVDLPPCDWQFCSAPRIRNRLRCELVHGNACCSGQNFIGTEIPNDPGDRGGLFVPAILQRWWADTDQRGNICHYDYRGNGKRVIRIVVLRPNDANGKKTMVVEGFAYFFMRRLPSRPGDDLVGEFLPARPQ